MSKETREHLSSLMDGELSQETAVFVARRMSSDPELGKDWERFHLIRECIRRPGETRAFANIELDLDTAAPVRKMAASPNSPGWLRPLAGLAVAASVAAVAIINVVNVAEPVGQPAAETAAQPFSSPNPLNTLPASQPVSFGPQSESARQLNGYLLRHNQAAGQVGRQGFVSFVPIVSATPVQLLEADESASSDNASGTPSPVADGQELP